MKIFLATTNKNKILEIEKILKDIDIELISINDNIKIPEVIEDGKTFEENSLKKAREIAKYTGMITIADDSGLCVEALNGAPGVYSARYSGENATYKSNNEKLLKDLSGEKNRNAKFVTVITLCKPSGESYSFRGELKGIILEELRGKDGFGYDPLFYLQEYGKTLAEMPEEKNRISHRAKAIRELKAGIKKIIS